MVSTHGTEHSDNCDGLQKDAALFFESQEKGNKKETLPPLYWQALTCLGWPPLV